MTNMKTRFAAYYRRAADPARRASPLKLRGIHLLMAAITLFGSIQMAAATPVPTNGPSLSSFATDDAFLDYIEKTTFQYFWNEVATNGLILSSSDANLASPTSTGLALSSYNIAIERGWITRSAGAARVLTTLKTFWNTPQSDVPGNLDSNGSHGFYYNRLDPATGCRNNTNQGVSSASTSIFLLGVIDSGLFFTNLTDQTEINIRLLSSNLVNRANYFFMKSPDNGIYASWQPESGYGNGDWSGTPQGYYLYLVGMGVPNNPLPPECWDLWTSSYGWQPWYGYNYVYAPALFQHTYTHCWYDLRGITDTYMWQRGSDYFEDARRAAYVMQAYAVDNPSNYVNYASNEWGFGDSQTPGGYNVCGGPPSSGEPDQGVISPAQVAGAMSVAPEICLPTLKNIYSKYTNLIWTTEGFRDCYVANTNVWGTTYFSDRNTALHIGRTLMAIENYRTGSTWNRMKTSPIIQRGLAQAGFFPSYPHDLVPPPRTYVDIGVPDGNAAGYSYYSNGVYLVSGGGAINAKTNDAIQYCYQPVNGDCVIQALLMDIGDDNTNTSISARSGVMIRETLNPDSKHASMLFQPTTNGAAFYVRTTTGGNNPNQKAAGLALPYWVKVTRSGNNFSGYVSPNGTNWTQVGTTKTIAMATNVYIGLVTASSQFGVPCDTHFSNVMPEASTNSAPVITEGTTTAVTMSEDGTPTAFGLTLHATDGNGDTITWSVSTPASHGTATASGTGASKVIGYTPTANYNGTDSFVVQVSDGNGGTDTITVNVTIQPVNDAPVLTVPANQTLNELTTLTVTNTATDVDIPANTLTFALVSGPTGMTINTNTGVIVWTPTEAQGPSTNTVTVSVTDNGVPNLSATNSFTVVVNGTPYQIWAITYGLTGGELDDPDHDGMNNLCEFALGGNPTNPLSIGYLPSFGKGNTNWLYVYPRRKNSSLTYWLETSTNLTANVWTNSGYTELVPPGNIDADFEAVTNAIPTATNQFFIRLRVKEN